MKNIEEIASICHSANRELCRACGDESQKSWYEAEPWQRQAAVEQVAWHLMHPLAGASASHRNWAKQKREEGWRYGAVKDGDAKTHPCLVPFGELPLHQQLKDVLFHAIVTALRPMAE